MQTMETFKTKWDVRKSALVSPKLTRAKTYVLLISAKNGFLVACASKFQPLCTLRRSAHGELNIFPNKSRGEIDPEMKTEQVGLIARALVAKTNAKIIMTILSTPPKSYMRRNRSLFFYHTAAHMTKKLTDMSQRG